MNPDPVQVIGFVGLCCAASFLLAAVWVASIEVSRWRYRRRARRADRVLGPRVPAAVERGGGWWAPEWEADWPQT